MDSEVVGTAEISAPIVHSCSHAVAAWPRWDLCGWRRLCFGSASLPHPTLSGGFLALCRLIVIVWGADLWGVDGDRSRVAPRRAQPMPHARKADPSRERREPLSTFLRLVSVGR